MLRWHIEWLTRRSYRKQTIFPNTICFSHVYHTILFARPNPQNCAQFFLLQRKTNLRYNNWPEKPWAYCQIKEMFYLGVGSHELRSVSYPGVLIAPGQALPSFNIMTRENVNFTARGRLSPARHSDLTRLSVILTWFHMENEFYWCWPFLLLSGTFIWWRLL